VFAHIGWVAYYMCVMCVCLHVCVVRVCVVEQGFWKGGKFQFKFEIPSDYPHSPPKTLCITKVSYQTLYHRLIVTIEEKNRFIMTFDKIKCFIARTSVAQSPYSCLLRSFVRACAISFLPCFFGFPIFSLSRESARTLSFSIFVCLPHRNGSKAT